MTAPVVLCGLGKVGSRIFEFLRAAGHTVVVIDRSCAPDATILQGARLVRGDFREPNVLLQAGIREARAVLIVTSDDLVNTATALTVRRLHPDVRIVVRMFNPNLLARLGSAVANMQALSVSALTAPLLAFSALTGEVLGTFTVRGERRQIAKLTLGDDSTLVGMRIGDVAREWNVIPLAHQVGLARADLFADVQSETSLAPGDELVVCGPPTDLARLLPLGESDDWSDLLPGVQWAGRLRRVGRVAWRALSEVDIALKACFVIMMVVVVSSTIIYASTGMSNSIPDGLYRTVSVIATGADMKADQYIGWQKVFVSALRIIGAVLTAAFTAIFTNYLLRARLGGALEVRRIPDAGHVVVCGLGNVGFRVVEELLNLGERVVVIERLADNPMIGTCRRLGAAVIIGDATLLEVLRQAHAGAARAVVTTTANDLANLEIVLLARDLNPKQRVVARMTDDALADTLRAVADVRLALALPSLAAPAFVAALYGDRVQSLFRINRRMLAAVDLTVQSEDPCLLGQTIRAVARDYSLLPLGEADPGRRLQAVQTLTAIALLTDLERLFRREPARTDCQVLIRAVPVPAREAAMLQLQLENGLTGEEAMHAMEAPPTRIGKAKTRGQAEELVALLAREQIEADITTS